MSAHEAPDDTQVHKDGEMPSERTGLLHVAYWRASDDAECVKMIYLLKYKFRFMARKTNKKPYPAYSAEVNATMASVTEFVAGNNGGTVPLKDRMLMDKLADFLNLYEKVREHVEQNGIVETDRFGNPKKSEYIKAQLEIFNQIFKIAGVYGLTLKDERKIQAAETDGESLVDLLTELNEN